MHITILGGGPAGLAAGYYAKKRELPFTIYEANSFIGGNSITFKHGDFLFDSGAHRFHNKYPDLTEEIRGLLGRDLIKIDVPSQIYSKGKFIDFPLSPLNLLSNLGPKTFFKAGLDIMRARIVGKNSFGNFEDFALSTYGKTIADLFLLNYSTKLWGTSCDALSLEIAGKRMKGLNLKTFVIEAILGKRAKTEHLDGSFYYPRMGIGTISEKLGEYCGHENCKINAGVIKVLHNNQRIEGVEIKGKEKICIDEVVSTLPLDQFLQMMDPKPPDEILLLSKKIRYRNIKLVALFLNRESISNNGSIYMPDSNFPFTRIYEPRNRCPEMSPKGKTSLIVEIPCQNEDNIWIMDDNELVEFISSKLIRIEWIKEDEIIQSTVKGLFNAYPILEVGFEKKVNKIMAYLGRFKNLNITGRSGKFMYIHIHDLMKIAKEIIENYNPKGS
jgi:protoporphyrinogen oxidase